MCYTVLLPLYSTFFLLQLCECAKMLIVFGSQCEHGDETAGMCFKHCEQKQLAAAGVQEFSERVTSSTAQDRSCAQPCLACARHWWH